MSYLHNIRWYGFDHGNDEVSEEDFDNSSDSSDYQMQLFEQDSSIKKEEEVVFKTKIK